MIQRSIELGDAEVVIVRAGGDCTVRGYDGDRVLVECENRWGMNVRIVARAGHVELFRGEWGFRPGADVKWNDDAVEVNAGGSCTAQVPRRCAVKVYAGRGATVEGVRGPVTVNAGGDVRIAGVELLEACNGGGNVDVVCQRLIGDDAQFSAGRDIRFYVRDLDDAHVQVNDAGGYWEGVIGEGHDRVRLKSGGAVTLVTDHTMRGKVLGQIEQPGAS